jgi:hypothetical protein
VNVQKRIGVPFSFSGHTYDRVKRVVVQVTQKSLKYSFKYNQQDATLYNFIAIRILYVSGGFYAHLQELKL